MMKRIICYFTGHDTVVLRTEELKTGMIWDRFYCRRCKDDLSEMWPGQEIPMSTGDWNKGAKE